MRFDAWSGRSCEQIKYHPDGKKALREEILAKGLRLKCGQRADLNSVLVRHRRIRLVHHHRSVHHLHGLRGAGLH